MIFAFIPQSAAAWNPALQFTASLQIDRDYATCDACADAALIVAIPFALWIRCRAEVSGNCDGASERHNFDQKTTNYKSRSKIDELDL